MLTGGRLRGMEVRAVQPKTSAVASGLPIGGHADSPEHATSAAGPLLTYKKHRSISAFGGLADIPAGKRHFR